MIKTILWDFDNTLLDFDVAEKAAIISTFKSMELGDIDDDMIKMYIEINVKYWQKIEKGEINKNLALTKRYEEFFIKIGVDPKCAFEFNQRYEIALADTIVYIDDSFNIVNSLKGQYKQYIVSNGAVAVQKARLKKSKFDSLMDGIFISDEINAEKPNIEFFNYVFETIKCEDKSELLIVGDSLTSDIKGGNNAKIATCWYNRKGQVAPSSYKIDYNIRHLNEIYDILGISKRNTR